VWFSVIKCGGRVVKLIGATQDITERRQAEQRLRDSEERLRQITENLREIVWVTAAETQEILYISPAYEQIYGRTCASLYAAPRSWLDAIHPDDRERAGAAQPGTTDVIRTDGQVRHIHARTFPVKNGTGQVYRIVGVAEDVTERRRVEEQFRQAQKMDAIGQLAGGVAHDFNNILSAILMQVEEASSHPAVDAELHESIAGIGAAADRAVKLTRQLLLFSRKQLMQPRQVDLNDVVSGFAQLLRRVLPESVDIRFRPAPRPATTLADPSMLEQVLMNLAVNARDAMPSGGTFAIEIGQRDISEDEARSIPEATAGRYVTLRVTDDGCGIRSDVLPRIFEPFFTTKEAGQGTGLGLATVFGIVKQHRGWISVDSAPGRGTAFDIVLPASPEPAKPRTRTLPPGMPRGGNETILLVEDDPSVRRLTRALLVRHGYQVLEARSGVEALEIWDAATQRIDLVLTDLVMPDGVSGRDLANRLQARAPALKVILTSGYGADVVPRSRETHLGPSFLAKPCTPRALLEAVRTCLDG
jgi:PAS domain S-box-containing protein